MHKQEVQFANQYKIVKEKRRHDKEMLKSKEEEFALERLKNTVLEN